jgi:O-antigen/teichoic acid export membrane protein
MTTEEGSGRKRSLDMDADASREQTLLSRASGALAWSFLNTIVGRLGTLGIGIALARLLGPEEFGTYAVALIALMATLSFNELGVSLAIVRWPGDPRTIAPTVTTLSLLTSTVIAGGTYLLAPSFAAAMGEPDAAPVVQLLGLTVVISGAVATPAALMQREFQQDRRMLIDQVTVWVGAISSIALALAGWGAMSLAVGRLGGAAIGAILFLRLSPGPYRLGWDRSHLRSLLRFGLPLAGASVIVFAIGFADQIVAGSMLGATALGFYVLAFNLSNWPVMVFSQPLRNVAPPTFARLQHEPEAMRRAFRSIVGLLAAVTFPVCLLLAGAAEPIIGFVYGAEWAPAASVLTWLGILAAFKILYELAYDYLVVIGASRAILALQAVTLVTLVPAVVVGIELSGIAGAAAAQVAVAGVVMLPLYAILFHRAGLHPGKLLGRLWLPVLIGGGVGLCALAVSSALPSNLAALALAGVVTLLALAILVHRDRAELRRLRGGSWTTPVPTGSAAA